MRPTSDTGKPPARTLLEAKIRERNMTLEEFAEYAEVFARENDESGTLSAATNSASSRRRVGADPASYDRPPCDFSKASSASRPASFSGLALSRPGVSKTPNVVTGGAARRNLLD